MPSTDQIVSLFDSLMRELGIGSSAAGFNMDIDSIRNEILSQMEVFKHEKPKIGLIGKIRAGKSTLGNTLFGKEHFETGVSIDLTSEVSAVHLKSGIVIYDTPGFQGFFGRETKSRELMQECDLILYVIRYPGQADDDANTLYNREIAPLDKPVVTVLNFDDDIEETDIQNLYHQFSRVLRLPNLTPVQATDGKNIDLLLGKIVDNLPERFQAVFRDSVLSRHQTYLNAHMAYNLTVDAAAVATCSRANEVFVDDTQKLMYDRMLLLSMGLALKISFVFETDNVKFSQDMEKLARSIQEQRWEQVIQRSANQNRARFTAVVGAGAGGLITAFISQTPAIAIALGLATSPFGGILAVIAAGGVGGAIGYLLNRDREIVQRIPKLGGFDMAVTVLSYGYTSYQASVGKDVTPQTFSDNLERAYNFTIRNILNPEQANVSNALISMLKNPMQGDRERLRQELRNLGDLKRLFLPYA